jgi:hypothetical protein
MSTLNTPTPAPVKFSELRFAIRSDVPFKMFHHHIILPCGGVAYTDHDSLESYAAEHGGEYRILDEGELDSLIDAAESALITDATSETESAWWEALECLPPCRWHHHAGVELFHISERLTGDLVAWHAKLDGAFYVFTDEARATSEHLAAKVAAARDAAPKV